MPQVVASVAGEGGARSKFIKRFSKRHLEASGSIWRQLEASGGIWRHPEASGGILEASGRDAAQPRGSARLKTGFLIILELEP